MLETKMFEVRDRGTYIPVAATKLVTNDLGEAYMLRRAGYSNSYPMVILTRLDNVEAHNDAYNWADTRTLREAHGYIAKNFDTLKSGDVVDVEFILGETTVCKTSERYNR